tara:strand:- start:2868 stop:3116 length:249 start_codon:yes stop_codon:yes gene_type:complete
MPSRSKSDKYWLANNPNGQVTDAQVVALKSLSNADLDEIDDLVAALPMAAEADISGTASAANNKAKINALLAKLRTAGLLAS